MKILKTARFITQKELIDSANGKPMEGGLVVVSPEGEKTNWAEMVKKMQKRRGE